MLREIKEAFKRGYARGRNTRKDYGRIKGFFKILQGKKRVVIDVSGKGAYETY